jgi:hypothetical protein
VFIIVKCLGVLRKFLSRFTTGTNSQQVLAMALQWVADKKVKLIGGLAFLGSGKNFTGRCLRIRTNPSINFCSKIPVATFVIKSSFSFYPGFTIYVKRGLPCVVVRKRPAENTQACLSFPFNPAEKSGDEPCEKINP